MKKRERYCLFALVLVLCMDVVLFGWCLDRSHQNRLQLDVRNMDEIRAMKVGTGQVQEFLEWSDADYSWQDYLCAYLISKDMEKKQLQRDIRFFRTESAEWYDRYLSYLRAIWEDLRYFPIPLSEWDPDLAVSYVDSWMFERTYGGKRGHEGCDLMASFQQRGYYPILSMTDGVVEQIGWLPKGGYRIGIRSPHGAYFYYAHLNDYAKEFKPGDKVLAGEWIGFMGDTGYSPIEGTVGNFDVHLHLGVYVNQPDGSEISFNPYALLQYLNDNRLKYKY